ncbi:MAG TPA: hypothetical protein VE465_06880 [Streptosporangiaceae bacterium]|jgi:hypothetical protein|nr:hypothetical protein [Streptosporangiaceae bacterium]
MRLGCGGLAVGGTSFGATLSLVAVADCDLFAAAIAQSGAYPRQLTPLGFHDEPRTLWEAPRVYRDFGTMAVAPPILPLIPTNWGFAATGHSRFVIKSTL